ncbi:MAG: hypothetical protein IMF11_06815 [Proteobacteria bacterium]|nr:hypothetical protein [Pseudomonadota bacterium]
MPESWKLTGKDKDIVRLPYILKVKPKDTEDFLDAIALAAQKKLVEWLLEEGYLYSARDEGSQEEGLLLPMEDWQALCKELGVKDA